MIRRAVEGAARSTWARAVSRRHAILGSLLAGPAIGYEILTRLRNEAYDRGMRETRRAPIPVVSVGNITVGGAGKTPVAAALAAELASQGHLPALVLRGYGDDEVRLHREMNPEIPVVPGRNRVEAVEQAAAGGARVAVVDDGFQHRRMHRDLDIVLVSADAFMRYRPAVLPAGPYREPLTSLRRADLVLVTHKSVGEAHLREVCDALVPFVGAVTVTTAALRTEDIAPLHEPAAALTLQQGLSRERVLAVCSIADPETFLEGIAAEAQDAALLAFPDHHEYTARDAERMLTRAAGRRIVTTTKDAVKLRSLMRRTDAVWVARQTVRFDDAAVVLAHLREVVDAG